MCFSAHPIRSQIAATVCCPVTTVASVVCIPYTISCCAVTGIFQGLSLLFAKAGECTDFQATNSLDFAKDSAFCACVGVVGVKNAIRAFAPFQSSCMER